MFENNYFVYILASRRNGTLYIGVTNNLWKRAWQHREKMIEGFTKKYHVHQLVYFEVHHDMRESIMREKQLKAWKRQWKLKLIEKMNPNWDDLFNKLPQEG